MDHFNFYKLVEFPKIYKRKWAGIDFLIKKSEELIAAYGETNVIDKSKKKKIVFFTGSGISKESGIPTFRDNNGLWEQYPVDMVASINGWYSDPVFVNEFYNLFRQKYASRNEDGQRLVNPNGAHKNIVKLALENDDIEVVIITQNVDDLHEQAIKDVYYSTDDEDEEVEGNDDIILLNDNNTDTSGKTCCNKCGDNCKCSCCTDNEESDNTNDSELENLPIKIIHLHGEIMKMCAENDKENKEYHVKLPYKRSYEFPVKAMVKDIFPNAKINGRMRPYIVFFGEDVPNMGLAINEVEECDAFIVIGTSLQVYPAASLLSYVPYGVPIIYIDPNPSYSDIDLNTTTVINKTAVSGMNELLNNWKKYVR